MNIYRPRIIEDKLTELFRHFPVVAVLGARQVGKSTLVQNLFGKKIPSIVFDPVVDVGNARQDPEFFLQNNPPPVFLDEIQYAPELLGPIKRQVDRSGKKGLYLLSGSQHLAVMRDIAESLAGRVAVVPLYPMTRREMAGQKKGNFLKNWVADETGLGIDRSLSPPLLFPQIWRGGYPGLLDLPIQVINPYWQSYLQTYIERDVRSVTSIGSLQTFGRFVRLLSALTSQEINFAHLGRDLGVDRKTAQAWLETVESTFLWFSLPAFSRNPIKRIA